MSGLKLFTTKETLFKPYTYMYMFIMFITSLCPGITGQILIPKFLSLNTKQLSLPSPTSKYRHKKINC